MNEVFDLCVRLLTHLAAATGLTYKEINVWVFIVIWPAFTAFLVVLVLVQHARIRGLENSR